MNISLKKRKSITNDGIEKITRGKKCKKATKDTMGTNTDREKSEPIKLARIDKIILLIRNKQSRQIEGSFI